MVFDRKYCKRHGVGYYGYICPECAKELEKEANIREQTKKKRKESWDSIIWPDSNNNLDGEVIDTDVG